MKIDPNCTHTDIEKEETADWQSPLKLCVLFLPRVTLRHLNDLHANIPQLFHHGGGGQFIGDDGPHFLQVQAGIGANDAHLGVVGQDEVAVGVAEPGLIDAPLRWGRCPCSR